MRRGTTATGADTQVGVFGTREYVPLHRGSLVPRRVGEVVYLDPGGGIIPDTVSHAGAAVIRGAKLLGADGKPVGAVVAVICRKVIPLFASNAIRRRIGAAVEVIDSGDTDYIVPWATEDQPLIAKSNCRGVGECTKKDFKESCGRCVNNRSHKTS